MLLFLPPRLDLSQLRFDLFQYRSVDRHLAARIRGVGRKRSVDERGHLIQLARDARVGG